MAKSVWVVQEGEFISIYQGDSIVINYPINLIPSLAKATPRQFSTYRIQGNRIFWDQIGFSLLLAEPLLHKTTTPAHTS